MKRFVSTILVAALLMVCMASMAAYAAGYVYLTGDANVRTGPGLSYASIGSVNKGSSLTYLNNYSYDNRSVCWYKVSFGGSTGWVSSTYASLSNSGGIATYGGGANGYSSGYSYSGTVYVDGDVNVRTGPGTNYGKLIVMKKGASATYLGNTSYDSRGVAWYNVSYGGYTGWVSSTYARLGQFSSAPSYNYSNNYSYSSYVRGTSGDSNVRTGPGLSYSSIGDLKKGESAPYLGNVSVDARGVSWYNISFNGRSAWVSSRYTSLY